MKQDGDGLDVVPRSCSLVLKYESRDSSSRVRRCRRATRRGLDARSPTRYPSHPGTGIEYYSPVGGPGREGDKAGTSDWLLANLLIRYVYAALEWLFGCVEEEALEHSRSPITPSI